MKPEIFIRADGNHQIGLGHLVRCSALAHMLKNNFIISFFCLEIPDKMLKELADNDFHCIRMKNEDLLFSKISAKSIVILDGYHFDTNYQKKIKQKKCKLVCIDDLHDKEYVSDLIVNHSPGISPEDYNSKSYTNYALGPEFALLRPLFNEAAKNNRKISKVDSAFVCFGGSDQFNLTYKTTLALLKIKQFKQINIVLGIAYEDPEIFELEKSNPSIKLYKNLTEKDLISVMQESNFAIIPASNILFEIMAVNIPFITGYYVDNQKHFYNYLTENNLAFGLGNFVSKTDKEIKKYILNFLLEKGNLSSKTNSLIDGKSPERILTKIKNLYHD
ncbi:MAG: UDP-2,4-diacetamido-2,4,6-trideoxy-beta-L-altropyranose hydrolase [Bacteroidales bacterium]|nr:UDP-2,4-diacetamido-2,4,6-trideoxy-beta-L-altropyranose hydrolase [Bacteroidales bacterium]